MKKQLLFLTLSFLFFTTSIYAQRWEFGVTMKSNFSILDIEDDIYEDAVPWVITGSTGGTFTPSWNTNIYRSATGRLGLEIGFRMKYYLMGRISLISGLEGRFISFRIKHNNPNRGLQNLLYLNLPLNIGYTTKSEKWTFFGGLWYSYLLQADFEKDIHYPIHTTRHFEQNVLGINVGIDFKINSNMAISLNYSGLATNLFARYTPEYRANPATFFDRNTNTVIDNPHPDAGTVTWGISDEKIPATDNFNLISLGITYQIKGK